MTTNIKHNYFQFGDKSSYINLITANFNFYLIYNTFSNMLRIQYSISSYYTLLEYLFGYEIKYRHRKKIRFSTRHEIYRLNLNYS